MIIAVDDEPEMLEFLTRVLTGAGYRIRTFAEATEALHFARENVPRLILSDVVMPEMDGMAFRAAYQRDFPQRGTPFIFLSSQSDPTIIVQGLAAGADDYLLKPLHPEILKVKVRNLLERQPAVPTPPAHAFYGDLGKFPLVKIMQFCETRGFTGLVEIPVGKEIARLRFVGGRIDLGNDEDTALLDQLYDMDVGTFSLLPQAIDFSTLAEVAVTQKPAHLNKIDKPMGKLSGIKMNQRLFQIQTEFVTYPEHQVLSIVILDGKVLLKRGVPTSTTERETLARLIEEQHQRVEAEVREKTAELGRARKDAEESPQQKFGRLVEAGFEHYRQKEYRQALDCWSEAGKIEPDNKTIATNLTIVRKKLGVD